MRQLIWIVTIWLLGLAAGGAAFAGPAEVVAASAACSADGTCRFSVTLRHADTGWDHYANRWQVLGPGGTVYGTRTLHHPHVDEQPFTRSLAGVKIPAGTTRVIIRARDSVHGEAGAPYSLDLSSD